MEVDKKLIDALPSLPNTLIEPILFIRKIEKPKDNGKVGHRIFLTTIFGAYFYKMKFLSKKAQLDIFIQWNRVKEIYSQSENEIVIKYDDKTISFRDSAQKLILMMIIKNLVNIFQASELPAFKSDQYVPDPDYTDKYFPQYKRFLFKCRDNDRTPNPQFLTEFNRYTQDVRNKHNVEFNMGLVNGFEPYADLILDSLDVCNWITTLIVPLTPDHKIWEPLANFIRRTNFITSIEIEDQIADGFNTFIQAIIQNPLSKIQSLLFRKSIVTAADVKQLFDLMKMKPILQLGFDESVSNFYPIIKVFASNNQFESLRSLTIKNVKGASAKNAIKHLPKLIRLDFSYNDVDITPTIKEIASTKNCKIREIICSGNYCKMLPQRKMKLCRKFDKFIGHDIKWHGNNLLSFINIFAHNSKNPDLNVVIDLSNADIEPEAKEVLFEKIIKYPIPNLSAFKWDSNPLHENFFEFLSLCKKLRYLSLNGCFSTKDNTIDMFNKFIPKLRQVRKFSLQGRDEHRLGIAIGRILDNLNHKNVSLLDISDNCIQDEMFPMLRKFLDENKTIESLYIDKNNIQDPNGWRSFIVYLKERNIKLGLQLPHSDLKDINSKEKAFKKRDLSQFVQDLLTVAHYPKYSEKSESLSKNSPTMKKSRSEQNLAEKKEKRMVRSVSVQEMKDEVSDDDEDSITEIAKKMQESDGESSDDNSPKSDDNENDEEEKQETETQQNPPKQEIQIKSPQPQQIINSLAQNFSPGPSPQQSIDSLANPINILPPPQKTVNYKFVGGSMWSNVEILFIDDTAWAKSYKISLSDNTQSISQRFDGDFALSKLIAAIRSK